jgi:hypothetical protein
MIFHAATISDKFNLDLSLTSDKWYSSAFMNVGIGDRFSRNWMVAEKFLRRLLESGMSVWQEKTE